MMHKKFLAVCALVLMLGLIFAEMALAPPGALSLDYRRNVDMAIEWFGTDTRSGSSLLSVTEPAFAALNQSFPGHNGYYDPWASESPLVASFAASDYDAHYLAVTDLQANGSFYEQNFVWRTFNSSSLFGALLVYSNPDVRIYCLVGSC